MFLIYGSLDLKFLIGEFKVCKTPVMPICMVYGTCPGKITKVGQITCSKDSITEGWAP